MNPDRWQQVERIYHAALEKAAAERPAFLAEACRDDSDLRRQVEELIHRTESSSPLDRAAVELLDSGELRPETQLGPYRILEAIGTGGMGKVYKAADTRLDRVVAIKVSKSQFSGRFQREARAIAALNHPNVCTLYDVGPDYLVMEYIAGEPSERAVAGGVWHRTRRRARPAARMDVSHRRRRIVAPGLLPGGSARACVASCLVSRRQCCRGLFGASLVAGRPCGAFVFPVPIGGRPHWLCMGSARVLPEKGLSARGCFGRRKAPSRSRSPGRKPMSRITRRPSFCRAAGVFCMPSGACMSSKRGWGTWTGGPRDCCCRHSPATRRPGTCSMPTAIRYWRGGSIPPPARWQAPGQPFSALLRRFLPIGGALFLPPKPAAPLHFCGTRPRKARVWPGMTAQGELWAV